MHPPDGSLKISSRPLKEAASTRSDTQEWDISIYSSTTATRYLVMNPGPANGTAGVAAGRSSDTCSRNLNSKQEY